MKRAIKESIEIFFIGYNDNKDAQKYHIIKRIIWLIFILFIISLSYGAIKSLINKDFFALLWCIIFICFFSPPIFLIKLD